MLAMAREKISLANKTDQGNPLYEIYGIQEGALVSWSREKISGTAAVMCFELIFYTQKWRKCETH